MSLENFISNIDSRKWGDILIKYYFVKGRYNAQYGRIVPAGIVRWNPFAWILLILVCFVVFIIYFFDAIRETFGLFKDCI